MLEVSEGLKKRYFAQAQLAPLTFLLSALQILNTCDVNYTRAKNKRLHAEMAILKISHIHRTKIIEPEFSEKKRPDTTSPEQIVHVYNLPDSAETEVPEQSLENEVTESLEEVKEEEVMDEPSGTGIALVEEKVAIGTVSESEITRVEPVSKEADAESPITSSIPKLNSLASIQSDILKDKGRKKDEVPFTQDSIQSLWGELSLIHI